MIETSGHLPECPCPTDDDDPWYCCSECNPGVTPPWERACICPALRACEERVTHKEFLLDEGDPYREVYRSGYRNGLDAAREAVASAGVRKDTSYDMRMQALAAIDALKGRLND